MSVSDNVFRTILPLITGNHNSINLKIGVGITGKFYNLYVIDDMKSIPIPISDISKVSTLDIVNADGEYDMYNINNSTFIVLSYTYNDADSKYRSYGAFIDKSLVSSMDFLTKIQLMIEKDYRKFINNGKKVCIAGSLSVSDKIEEIAKQHEKEGYEVFYAKEQPDKSLLDVDLEFIKMINWCDIFIVVPKEDGSIGDSVTYEKAIAKFFNKKIIEWKDYEKS